jgi:phenylalanyl-tRNA synthetase beta chain
MFVTLMMDVGAESPIQIVTGAWNIHVGDLVPVARHGSLLPGGKRIERGNCAGSCPTACSAP